MIFACRNATLLLRTCSEVILNRSMAIFSASLNVFRFLGAQATRAIAFERETLRFYHFSATLTLQLGQFGYT